MESAEPDSSPPPPRQTKSASSPPRLLDELLGRRALPRNDVRMIVRRNQRETVTLGQLAADALAVFGITVVGHDVRTVAARGRDLGSRRIQRHDDRCGNTQQLRGQRDGLRMVARRKRDDARRALPLVELRQCVERAAKLEGAHALEVLALEEHLRAEHLVDGAGGQHGRHVCKALDPSCRCAHILVSR